MNTRIILWSAISVLFVAALILTFKAGIAGNIETAQVVNSASKGVAQSYGGMVGGC
ncbi:hypothetical protein J4442_03230 [Candidatus Woesearchaeota archaeon]|nr:hypothetical protein [Candidatus Woesearchaeota archaeon]